MAVVDSILGSMTLPVTDSPTITRNEFPHIKLSLMFK